MSLPEQRLMSPEQVACVKRTWADLEPNRTDVGARFYLRLFRLDPSLRPLFTGDLSEQSQRLVVMLGIAVKGLDELSVLQPILQALGERHARYGVDADHYGTVGAALLWAVGAGLGEDFDAEAEAAWAAFYALIAEGMQSGTRPT